MTFARVFTGLDRQLPRANFEEVRSWNGRFLGFSWHAFAGPALLPVHSCHHLRIFVQEPKRTEEIS